MSIPPPPAGPPRFPGDDGSDDESSLTGELFRPDILDALPADEGYEPESGDGRDSDLRSGTIRQPADQGAHERSRQQAHRYWAPGAAPDAGAPPALLPPAEPPTSQPPVPARDRSRRGPASYLLLAGVTVLALVVGGVLGATLFTSHGSQATPPPTPSISVSPLPSAPPSGSQSPSGAPSPGASSSGAVPLQITRFASPSKNISCLIDGGAVRCDIEKKTYKDPAKPGDCHAAFGRSITANSAGVTFGCVSDTVADPDLPVLAYDQATAAEGVTCTSRKTGMRCEVDATGHGFTLASESYQTF